MTNIDISQIQAKFVTKNEKFVVFHSKCKYL